MLKCLFFVCFFNLVLQGSSVFCAEMETNKSVFMSEINFAGSQADNHCKSVKSVNRCGFDKWVEITNSSNQSRPLGGWKLKMNEGRGVNEWFSFPADTYIPGLSSIVVGYSEVNFVSVLELAGLHSDFASYSLLRVSNNDAHTVHVALVDDANQVVDSLYMDTSVYPLQDRKFSLEKVEGAWIQSMNEFYPGNWGTPGKYPYFELSASQPDQQSEVVPSIQEQKIATDSIIDLIEPELRIVENPVSDITPPVDAVKYNESFPVILHQENKEYQLPESIPKPSLVVYTEQWGKYLPFIASISNINTARSEYEASLLHIDRLVDHSVQLSLSSSNYAFLMVVACTCVYCSSRGKITSIFANRSMYTLA